MRPAPAARSGRSQSPWNHLRSPWLPDRSPPAAPREHHCQLRLHHRAALGQRALAPLPAIRALLALHRSPAGLLTPGAARLAHTSGSMAGFYSDIVSASGVYRYFVDGQWKESTSGKTVSVINPTTQQAEYQVQGARSNRASAPSPSRISARLPPAAPAGPAASPPYVPRTDRPAPRPLQPARRRR